MAYRIDNCRGDEEQIEEISEFLASFVADGEGSSRDPDSARAATWRNRLRWWWVTNPFCRDDSPRGFILRADGGEIVGFYGLIPRDYRIGDQIVPALIGTTYFVREANRDGALGLFLRAQRLRKEYHLVDGGPNHESQALLARGGYRQAGPARLFFYPVKRKGWRIKSWPFQAARLLSPRSKGAPSSGRFVTNLAAVAMVPEVHDEKLRKHTDRDSLAWYLKSGSRPKHFLGWCDGSGTLRCYLIGFHRRKFGLSALVVIDYAAFDDKGGAMLDHLMRHLADHPDDAGLPAETDLVVWPVCNGEQGGSSRLTRDHESNVFFHSPPEWAEARRFNLPFEGDHAFL